MSDQQHQQPDPLTSPATRNPVPTTKSQRKSRELTNNALIGGVVSAAVAGIIAFIVAHFQANDAVDQARQAQQV
jgi:hypothetical protein